MTDPKYVKTLSDIYTSMYNHPGEEKPLSVQKESVDVEKRFQDGSRYYVMLRRMKVEKDHHMLHISNRGKTLAKRKSLQQLNNELNNISKLL